MKNYKNKILSIHNDFFEKIVVLEQNVRKYHNYQIKYNQTSKIELHTEIDTLLINYKSFFQAIKNNNYIIFDDIYIDYKNLVERGNAFIKLTKDHFKVFDCKEKTLFFVQNFSYILNKYSSFYKDKKDILNNLKDFNREFSLKYQYIEKEKYLVLEIIFDDFVKLILQIEMYLKSINPEIIESDKKYTQMFKIK